jgi:hypothetical protein
MPHRNHLRGKRTLGDRLRQTRKQPTAAIGEAASVSVFRDKAGADEPHVNGCGALRSRLRSRPR